MEMLKDCIEFYLDGGTYDFNTLVIITEDRKILENVARQVFGDKEFQLSTFDYQGIVPCGQVLKREGYISILWIPRVPETAREIGTLFHELFHIVFSIMNWAKISLVEESEEAYCHLIGYLTTQFYDKIQRHEDKKKRLKKEKSRKMPFKLIKKGKQKGKYKSPSGKIFTASQVKRYYARGGKFK